MHKRSNKVCLFHNRKVSTTLLLPLAFLFLFVSCPLKKLLLKEFNNTFTSAARSDKTNINPGNDAHFTIANANCSLVKKPSFTTESAYHIHIKAPVYFLNSTNSDGFKINYFLNGLNGFHHRLTIHKNLSVPLFLEHLKLLI